MPETPGELEYSMTGAIGEIADHTVDLAQCRLRPDSEARKENARRLVACWNFFEGVSTEVIEKLLEEGIEAGIDLVEVVAERDAALAMLRRILGLEASGHLSFVGIWQTKAEIEALLARAEGQPV